MSRPDDPDAAVDLRLFGAIHIDRPGKVQGELSAFAAGVDAVFVELPRELTWSDALGALVVAPSILLGGAVRVLIFGPLLALSTRSMLPSEATAVERLANERDLPVHRVDVHPYRLLRSRPRWAVPGWGVLGLFLAVSPLATLATAGPLIAGLVVVAFVGQRGHPRLALVGVPTLWIAVIGLFLVGLLAPWLLVASFLAFAFLAVATLDRRNSHMLGTAAEIAADRGYERACLVTGRAHVDGMVEDAPAHGVAVTRATKSKWLRRSGVTDGEPDAGREPPA